MQNSKYREHRDAMHKVVELHIQRLSRDLTRVVANAPISLTGGAAADAAVQSLIQKIHVNSLLHSCRTLTQVASDVAVSQILLNLPRRHAQEVAREAVSAELLADARAEVVTLCPLHGGYVSDSDEPDGKRLKRSEGEPSHEGEESDESDVDHVFEPLTGVDSLLDHALLKKYNQLSPEHLDRFREKRASLMACMNGSRACIQTNSWGAYSDKLVHSRGASSNGGGYSLHLEGSSQLHEDPETKEVRADSLLYKLSSTLRMRTDLAATNVSCANSQNFPVTRGLYGDAVEQGKPSQTSQSVPARPELRYLSNAQQSSGSHQSAYIHQLKSSLVATHVPGEDSRMYHLGANRQPMAQQSRSNNSSRLTHQNLSAQQAGIQAIRQGRPVLPPHRGAHSQNDPQNDMQTHMSASQQYASHISYPRAGPQGPNINHRDTTQHQNSHQNSAADSTAHHRTYKANVSGPNLHQTGQRVLQEGHQMAHRANPNRSPPDIKNLQIAAFPSSQQNFMPQGERHPPHHARRNQPGTNSHPNSRENQPR